MKLIEIYTKTICPYCVKAKALFDRKGIFYHEIKIDDDDALRDLMVQRSGGRKTVPQIFIGDFHVGGCDDLHLLENDGKLDDLLGDFS
jgi:glutaredoxin 3